MTTLANTEAAFDLKIDGNPHQSSDPVLTGRQVIDLAGLRPADEHIVFLLLDSGLLEELRLDETTDLRQRGVEEYLTFQTDRSFRFILEGRQFEWGAALITGATLKKLANVDQGTYDVWLEVRQGEDQKIDNCDKVDLSESGTERFFTAKKTTTEG